MVTIQDRGRRVARAMRIKKQELYEQRKAIRELDNAITQALSTLFNPVLEMINNLLKKKL